MNTNLNRILFIFAGICFIFTYFLTKNFTYLPLGLCSLILSTNKKEDFTMKSSLDLNTYEHVQTDPLPLHFQLKIHAQLLYKIQWLHQTQH